MLLTKIVKLKWNNSNKNYYISKGYIYTKIGNEFLVKVEDLSKGSIAVLDVICDECGEELKVNWTDYRKQVKEDGKYYCQKCAIKLYGVNNRIKSRLNNSKSFEQWCIDNNRQDVLDRWDCELNNCKPSEILFSSAKRYYFKCPRNIHLSEKILINSITSLLNKCDCKACKSLYQGIIDNFGLEFFNTIWSDKNVNIDPYKYSYSSTKILYWKCENKKHKDYPRLISNSSNYHFRCPECMKESKSSLLQQKVKLYIESLKYYTILHEYKCTIVPHNPKHKGSRGQMPFDNEIKELKLIIETHGIQHYELLSKSNSWIGDLTPKEYLHKIQLYDRYKRIFAKRQGYFYLEIPYWTDDKNETYKQLINNKINEIINMNNYYIVT